MAQSQQQTDAERRAERTPAGQNPDTTLTEETADQLRRGVSPTSDDASAAAERAVADEPTTAARDRRGAGATNSDLEARVAALEEDLRKLRGQLRHSL